MTAGAEVPCLAGEGQQFFVAAIGALETGKAGGEIAAAVELVDDGHGIPSERAVRLPVDGFVSGHEVVPGMVDDLPERRSAGASRAVDRGHSVQANTYASKSQYRGSVPGRTKTALGFRQMAQSTHSNRLFGRKSSRRVFGKTAYRSSRQLKKSPRRLQEELLLS